MIDPGELREVVTIEGQVRVDDAGGGYAYTWTAKATDVLAKVEPLSGSEQLRGDVLQALTMVRITVRHRSDITTADRVLWDGREFHVKSVGQPADDFRRQWSEIMVQEGVEA